ncbi:hypothetical protein Hanom_Chr02g00160851 [Helianthus anomalus]
MLLKLVILKVSRQKNSIRMISKRATSCAATLRPTNLIRMPSLIKIVIFKNFLIQGKEDIRHDLEI